nr:uncharacterized protein LOC128703530 [Cherax quadricarinatus]
MPARPEVCAKDALLVRTVEVEVHHGTALDDLMQVEGMTQRRTAMLSDSDDVLTPAQRPGKKTWADAMQRRSSGTQGQGLGVRVSAAAVSAAAVTSLPSTQERVELELTDVSDDIVSHACDLARELQPPGGIVKAFQERRMVVNSAVEVCLYDVSTYVTWVKVRNVPFEAEEYDL